MRLVDADEIMKKLNETQDAYLSDYYTGIEDAKKIVDRMPSIIPENLQPLIKATIDNMPHYLEKMAEEHQKIRGHWVAETHPAGFRYYHCSACEKQWYPHVYYDGVEEMKPAYCPSCGADMRGEEEND